TNKEDNVHYLLKQNKLDMYQQERLFDSDGISLTDYLEKLRGNNTVKVKKKNNARLNLSNQNSNQNNNASNNDNPYNKSEVVKKIKIKNKQKIKVKTNVDDFISNIDKYFDIEGCVREIAAEKYINLNTKTHDSMKQFSSN